MFSGFGRKQKKPTASQVAKSTSRTMRKENRNLDREIGRLAREQKKIEIDIKKAHAKGDMRTVKTLAKALVKSRSTSDRLRQAQGQNTSLSYSIQTQAASAKIAETMKTSAQVMGQMNQAMNVQELQRTTQNFQKAQMQQEMVADMIEDMLDDDEDLEEEADQEIDNVLFEITKGQLGTVQAPSNSLATKQTAKNEISDAELEAQMAALLSG